MNIKSESKGFSLIELMITVGFVAVIAIAMSTVLEFIVKAAVKSREQTTAANLSQRFFTRLNSIPYPYVYDMDSSSPSFGLSGTFGNVSTQISTYPYVALFNEYDALMRSHKFDRFTLSIRFMVRDLSDLDSDGQTTDLRYYSDTDGDNLDQYDSALRYSDQNSDGDFRDTYSSPEVTEEPHTRLKEATFKLYKRNELIFQETQLVSWEKFTGAEGKAAGATLSLIVSTPSENSAIYSLATSSHTNSFNLVLSTPYPSDVIAFRSDSASPLHIMGETTPNATFSWRLGTTTSTVTDTCAADFLGTFDCTVTNIAANLTEGVNTIWGQAYKTVYYSPWTPTTVIRDVSTPTVTAQEPTGTIYNLQPTVRAKIEDNPHAVGNTVAGINVSLIRLSSGTAKINHSYDASTGYVTWIDSNTGQPPVLGAGNYTIVLEGGDNAFYKVRSTWTFTVPISTGDTDNSEPSVSHKDPSGFSASNPPLISCRIFDNQSGIIMNSVVMMLDGVVVVSSTTGNLSTALSPLAQQDGYTVTYLPESALSSGSHDVRIIGDHWATDPANKITKDETWSFFVP